MVRHTDAVDAEHNGRTALWLAVFSGNVDNAKVLVAAGADPWRPMMAGWSPGRLSLASRTPDLFTDAFAGDNTSGIRILSPAEVAAVAEARRLIEVLADLDYVGPSLSCVRGIDAAEAVRRLEGVVVDPGVVMPLIEDGWQDEEEDMLIVGVTDVPGGCVVSQPWGYGAATEDVGVRLSTGTVCHTMYANPAQSSRGSIMRDGVEVGWDLDCAWTSPDDSAEEILRSYLYQNDAFAYCCSYADLRPADARAFTDQPDLWVRMPKATEPGVAS